MEEERADKVSDEMIATRRFEKASTFREKKDPIEIRASFLCNTPFARTVHFGSFFTRTPLAQAAFIQWEMVNEWHIIHIYLAMHNGTIPV